MQESAQGLAATAHPEMTHVDVGRRIDYHLSSWFIHAVALSERVGDVITQTTETYMGHGETAKTLAKQYREQVSEEMQRLKTMRNQFVHPNQRFLAGALTTGGFWESGVAVGMTPQMFLDEFRNPAECERLRAGKYAMFATETTMLCDSLGSILDALEKDIPAVSSLYSDDTQD